jgi:hypothetical protein
MLRNSQRSSSVKSLQAPERGYTQAARVKDLLACESLPFLSHAYDEPARAVINNGRAWLLNDESDNNLTSGRANAWVRRPHPDKIYGLICGLHVETPNPGTSGPLICDHHLLTLNKGDEI